MVPERQTSLAMKSSARTAALLVWTLALRMTSMIEAQGPPKSLDQEAKRQVGHTATLCGTVVAYQCERPERTSLLALEKPLSGPGVSVAISRKDRDRFGPLLESRYVLQSVCATGPVEKRKNRYLIAVTDPAQLQLQAGGSPPSVAFGPDAVSACDEGVELPKLLEEVKPEYSQAGLNARIQGAVLVEAVVLTNGHVGTTRLLQSLDARSGLDDQALKALRSWRFLPGTLQGRPVPVIVTVELSFRMRR